MAAEEEADELLAEASSDAQLLEWTSRRTRGEPLAWIVGSVTFCGNRVLVHRGVYVPRWQSELLVARARSVVVGGDLVVDLCTGAGAIAVALQHAVPTAEIIATEIDPLAARCARANGVTVVEGDLFDGVPERFRKRTALVVGVVPYVPSGEMHLLPRDVLAFEPRRALDGGSDGLALLRRTAEDARAFLIQGGHLLLELGGDEGKPLSARLDALGYGDIECVFDEDGDVRGISASWGVRDHA